MASIDSRKRKLAEDGAIVFAKSHKRHRSDHTPIPAIDYQAQLRNGKTSEAVDIASVTIAPPVKEVAKQQRDSDKPSHSAADPTPGVRPAKVRPSKKTAQKQKVSSSELSSSDEDDTSIADLADEDAHTASKLALIAASTSPSEAPSGEGDESEEEEDDDDEEDEKEEEPESGIDSESSNEWASDAVLESESESHPENNNNNNNNKEIVKADDPSAFASSMSAILSSNLTRTQRANPILARSVDAKEAETELLDRKLERKARAEMKKEKSDKGGWEPDMMMMMVKDDIHVGDIGKVGPHAAYQRREKELRKMAQRGVVKMFNAFAHVREKAVEAQGMGGSRAKREEKATEMTKEGWLEYVGGGGKGKVEEKGQREKKGKSDET